LQKLDACGLDVMKTPASTTGVLQPLDVSPCFKTLKRLIAYTKKSLKVDKNDVVMASYKAVVDELGLSALTRRRVDTMILFLHTHLSTAFTMKNVRYGFQQAGVYPFKIEAIIDQARTLKPLMFPEKATLVDQIQALETRAR